MQRVASRKTPAEGVVNLDDIEALAEFEQVMLEVFANIVFRYELSGGTDEGLASRIDVFMAWWERREGSHTR